MSKTITCIIVGAGHRALYYASYALEYPEKMKIVGVVDPLEHRREVVMKTHGLDKDACFKSVEELCAKGKLADAVINGTMDQFHVGTSIPLLEAGYDILLEKPFAVDETEMWKLIKAVHKYNRKILICHVLRYAPFYMNIRRKIVEGRLGKIMNIQTNEHVSYHHEATAYIRGKWNRKDVCGSGHLMAKCCHDLDLIMWMFSGNSPVAVSSFGNRMFFRQENAPEGSGYRCLVDCSIEDECCYSARKLYIEGKLWKFYAWEDIEDNDELTDALKLEHLKTNSPYGRCVWRCDNDIVDHQSVMIRFANGATATHNMVGGSARPLRSIHIIGTQAELYGVLEEGKIEIHTPSPGVNPKNCTVEEIDLNLSGAFDGMVGDHGGGDMRLVADFVALLQGRKPSIACTAIQDSIYGHLVGFKAEQARENDEIAKIEMQ